MKSNRTPRLTFALLLLSLTLLPVASAQAACQRPWIFFDLGETLVDTRANFNPMFLMPGALEFLQELDRNGFRMGLIIDVPGEWGQNYPAGDPIRDFYTAKVARSIDFVEAQDPTDGVRWMGPAFPWFAFGRFIGTTNASVRFEGRILLPRTDAERKDSGSPVLFERAREMALRTEGCPALYLSEEALHLQMASGVGLIPYQIDPSRPRYPSVAEILGHLDRLRVPRR